MRQSFIKKVKISHITVETKEMNVIQCYYLCTNYIHEYQVVKLIYMEYQNIGSTNSLSI